MARRRKRTANRKQAAAPLVPREVIRSTVVQNEFGRVMDRAIAGTDIAIAKHNVVRAVLVSAERYQELVRHQAVDLAALSSRFEELYASMQRPDVQSATDRALRATPTEMGRAAVAHARHSRRAAAGATPKPFCASRSTTSTRP